VVANFQALASLPAIPPDAAILFSGLNTALLLAGTGQPEEAIRKNITVTVKALGDQPSVGPESATLLRSVIQAAQGQTTLPAETTLVLATTYDGVAVLPNLTPGAAADLPPRGGGGGISV
jgi:hypothetical protein